MDHVDETAQSTSEAQEKARGNEHIQ